MDGRYWGYGSYYHDLAAAWMEAYVTDKVVVEEGTMEIGEGVEVEAVESD